MAFRASEAFVTATKAGKLRFTKNDVIPDALAKTLGELVYDDGAKPAAKRSTSSDAA